MKKTAEAIVVLLTLTVSLAAETQKEKVTWAEVASATSGAKITMMLPSGTEIRGRVLEVQQQALIVDVTKTSNSRDVEKGRTSIPRKSPGEEYHPTLRHMPLVPRASYIVTEA